MQLLSLLRSCSILSFLVLLHEILEVQSLYHGNRSKVPAVIIFGDSIVDPGNNNMLPTIAKCNFPPYGRDFIQHKPTGRFSNGKIPSDMLASALGIKEYLPAYLDPQLKPKDLLTGVSFASAGAGYDPLTAELLSVLSLSDQLEMFKEYIGKLKGIVGEERAGRIVSDSFYLVVFGFNDVATTYFFTPLRRIQYDFPSYSRFLAQSASSFFQELYNLGVRKIGVVGLPPIGCVPSQRTLAGGILRDCQATYNQAAIKVNLELSKALEDLRNRAEGVAVQENSRFQSYVTI
ncbi:GDSL esterase/lipase EXL3-like isoform X3 [Tasmannia lanceolata]|uniref:GDSL esterase/lipase EXL3-like isoform X3 n=1 Tax=Tasmannia lanceolata TaxID=3420 RepID=UPI004062AB54